MWDYFEKPIHGYAKCKLCFRRFKTSGNTSNLRDHLSRKHEKEYSIVIQSSEDSNQNENASTTAEETKSKTNSKMNIWNTLQNMIPMRQNSVESRRIDLKLLLMIARDYQPFSIVENKGFLEFVKELNPRYKMISRKTLTDNLLPKCVAVVTEELRIMLEKAKFVSICTDAWTSVSNNSYLGISVHFIEEKQQSDGINLCFFSAILDTVPIETNEKSDNLKTILKDVLLEWNIFEKTSCIVTDNAANMKKAADLLGVRHMPCFAHSLNLVIKNAVHATVKLDSNTTNVSYTEVPDDISIDDIENNMSSPNEVQKIINHCKEIVTFIHKSPKATRLLRKARKEGKEEGELVGELIAQVKILSTMYD